MASRLGALAIGMAGAVVGVAAAVFVLPRFAPRDAPPPEARVVDQARPGPEVFVRDLQIRRVGELERRVVELERRDDNGTAPPPPPARTERPASDPAAERAGFQAALAAHDAEPAGTPWAKAAAPRFEADLGTLAAQHAFAVDRVDCRGATCVADVAWTSPNDAQDAWRALLTYDYGVNCARNVLLREDVDARGRAHADLLFDCSSPLAPRAN